MGNSIFIILLISLVALSCEQNSSSREVDGASRLLPFSYASIDIQPIKFTIDNNRDTLLFGQTGVIIYVPAKAFVLKGKKSTLDLYLKEYSKPSQTLAQNISNTSSDNRLLTASTIIHLEAKQGNERLTMAPNNDLRVHFKQIKKAPKISLWSGEPAAWQPMKFDQPKLFNHMLKMGHYKETSFADGSSIRAWEKANLVINDDEEQDLWKRQLFLHLSYTIDKRGKLRNVSFREKIQTTFQKKVLKIMKKYPLCIPPNKATTCQYIFHVHQAEPKYKRDLNYLRILGKPYPELIANKIDHIDDVELKYHIFNIRKLGWIAAAQALEQPTSVDLVVNIEPSFLAEVKIMLKKSKIILKGKQDGNKVSFLGLPKDEAILIIEKKKKNKQPLLASINANSSDGIIKNLSFSTSSYSAIKSALKNIN